MSDVTDLKTNNGCGWAMILAPMFMIGCFFAMMCVNGFQAAQLAGEHQTIEATVIRSGMYREASRYEFEIDGETYQGDGGDEKEGDTIEVAYQQDAPSVNRPASGLYFDMALGAASLLLLIGIPIYIWGPGVKARFKPDAQGADQSPSTE
jgi:hypothetical protein